MGFTAEIIVTFVIQTYLYIFHASVLILLIVKRQGIFKGSFYNILRIVLVADLLIFIFTAISKRFPLLGIFTQFLKTDFILSSITVNITSGGTALQFLGHTFLTLNRFTFIWFPLKQNQLWNRQWYTVALIGFTLIYMSPRITEPGYFIFQSETSILASFRSEAVIALFYKISLVHYISTTCIAAILNVLSFAKFYFYKKVSTKVNINERHLLYVSFATFCAQLLRTSYNFKAIFFPTNPDLTAVYNAALPFLNDIFALSGSISLLILSKSFLKAYKDFYFGRYLNQQNSSFGNFQKVTPSMRTIT